MSAPFSQAGPDYLAHGWFPVPIEPEKKFPPLHGWTGKEASYPTEPIVAAWAGNGRGPSNVGLRPAADTVGIDVDAYAPKKGADTLAELEAKWGRLPSTWVSSRRFDTDRISGIRWFRLPQGTDTTHWPTVAGKHIDIIRAGHRYGVVWPSTVDGLTYAWKHQDSETIFHGVPDASTLPMLPDEWVEGLSRKAKREAPSDEWTGADATPAEIDAAKRILQQQSAKVERAQEGRRNQTLNDAAFLLGTFTPHYLSKRDVWDSLVTAAEKAGLEDEEITATLRSGLNAGMSEPQKITPDYDEEEMLAMAAEEPSGAGDPAPALSLDAMWAASPLFQHIHDAAVKRNRSPLTVLLGTLVLVSTSGGTFFTLPAVIGSAASPNLLNVMAGPPGSGKSDCAMIAEELVPTAMQSVHRSDVGTGEGLIGSFLGGKPDPVTKRLPQVRTKVFVYVDEFSQMEAVGSRSGATIGSTLRSMAMGRQVGNTNADSTRNRHLDALSYRLGMMIGVQPALSHGLLNAEETNGGTPQRFAWTEVRKPNVPVHARPDWPGELPWTPYEQYVVDQAILAGAGGVPPTPHVVIEYPEEITAHIESLDMAPVVDVRHAHGTLLRLKLAVAIAHLHQRWTAITLEDWAMAGTLVEESFRVQDMCREAMAAESRKESASRAHAQGEAMAISAAAKEEADLRQVKRGVLRYLERKGESTTKVVVHSVTKRLRPLVKPALAELEAEGKVASRPGRTAGSALWSLA